MRRSFLLLSSFLFSALAVSLLFLAITLQPSYAKPKPVAYSSEEVDWKKLHPDLIRLLANPQQAEFVPLIIEWKRDDTSLSLLAEQPYESKEAQRAQIVSVLKEETALQARNLMASLDAAQRRGKAREIHAFWVSPIISLQADPEFVKDLSTRNDVLFIRPDEKIELETSPAVEMELEATDEFLYNLDLVEVDKIEQFLGLRGNGIVVANIDSGVDGFHPALMKQYRGYNPHGPAQHNGNWYVVTGEPYLYPGDGLGHGTHTMGTMVGDDGLGRRTGIAPGAKWIAVKAFTNQGYTYESWIHAAFEWMLAPAGNPALAPDIVNNSWGTDVGSDPRFRADVQALRAAGILPVFSAGNNGPQKETVGAPASYPETLAVGAVDETKLPTHFSSRGPSSWGEVKPELSAPGVNVLSTFPGGGYAKLDGTSMAAPHVAGIAALLLEANPNLSVDQLEQILLQTAEPLSTTIPNNTSGYGLVNAYAAALQITQQGILRGSVKETLTNLPIPYATLTIKDRHPTNPTSITLSAKADGSFECHLPPGLYDITATRFDYQPLTKTTILIQNLNTTSVEFILTPRPSGVVRGKVLEVSTQIPLSATLTVEGTPLTVQSNPNTGDFQLRLPEGSWQVTVRATRHRIQRVPYTIQAEQLYSEDIFLDQAPHILLIDSGPWYYRSQIGYYERALDANLYPYHKLSIRSPYGINGIPDDRPSTTTLRSYDLVIWSAPGDSPGLIDVGTVLSDYLSAGGKLLLSGEDIAYLDAGGPNFFPPQYYLQKQMGVLFKDEGLLTPLFGKENSPFSGLTISLNTPDSAQQQFHPDSVLISNTLRTKVGLFWSGNENGGVYSTYCVPFKGIWFGFGLEGAGPESMRNILLQRAIDWFTAPKEHYALFAEFRQNTMVAQPGQTVTGTFRIVNRGTQADIYRLKVQGATWQTSIQLPNGQSFDELSTLSLPSCTTAILTATVQIPPSALRQQNSLFTLTITSQNDPSVQETLTMSAKTPAPLLVVDDQVWYDYLPRFLDPLDNLTLPYDIFVTKGFQQSPFTETLQMYPVVLWTTGYDWYFTLSPEDESRLTRYLDQGGGLLISSQDLLDLRQGSNFLRDKLGVGISALSVTSTQAIPVLQNPLKLPPQVSPLSFPFLNWSDSISPSSKTIPLLWDENLNLVGTLHSPSNARAAFFAIPLETMPDQPREQLIQRAIFWLSPFGETQFQIPRSVLRGSELPIRIELSRSVPSASVDRFILPIPPNTTLISSSLSGPWSYSSAENALIFQGNLPLSQKVTLKASLLVSDQVADNTKILIEGQFYDARGLVTKYRELVPVGQSYLEVAKTYSPKTAYSGNLIDFALTVSNLGVVSDRAVITETLSDQLQLIPSSILNDLGSVTLKEQSFIWEGVLSPQQTTTIRYQARLTRPSTRGFAYTRSEIAYTYGNYLAFAKIHTPWIYYFPLIFR
ncbi:MAG: S8 family serine peptidase [Anaerolineales bacterium]|nr:S8 family serine peptidase [Anaerolineales bacterium]